MPSSGHSSKPSAQGSNIARPLEEAEMNCEPTFWKGLRRPGRARRPIGLHICTGQEATWQDLCAMFRDSASKSAWIQTSWLPGSSPKRPTPCTVPMLRAPFWGPAACHCMHTTSPTPKLGQGPGQTGYTVIPTGQAVAYLTCRACERVCSHTVSRHCSSALRTPTAAGVWGGLLQTQVLFTALSPCLLCLEGTWP